MSNNSSVAHEMPEPPDSAAVTPAPVLVPSYRLFDSTSVALATLLGSPIAGTALVATNYRRLGRSNAATATFLIGLASTVLAMVFGNLVPSYATTAVAIGLFVATWNAAKSLQGALVEAHVARGGRRGSRWTASGLGLAVLAVICGSAAAIVMTRGSESKLAIGTGDAIFYSGSATKQDAVALGEVLKNAGYFRDTGASVLLSKTQFGTIASFVVQEGMWNRPEIVAGFEEVGREIAPSIGGFPLTVRLINSNREPEKELNVGRVVIGAKDEIFYLGSSTADQAKALGESLKSAGFLEDRGVSIFLAKDAGTTAVSFVVGEQAWQTPESLSVFEVLVRRSASAVGGLPVTLRLVDNRLEVKAERIVN